MIQKLNDIMEQAIAELEKQASQQLLKIEELNNAYLQEIQYLQEMQEKQVTENDKFQKPFGQCRRYDNSTIQIT